MLSINGWGIAFEIALSWLSQGFADDKSTLVQVMAWCRQATSHYLSQCWPSSLSPYGVTRPQWLKEPGHQETQYWPNKSEYSISGIRRIKTTLRDRLFREVAPSCIWQFVIMETDCICLSATTKLYTFSIHGLFLFFFKFRNFKIVYRRYAGLYFCICVDVSDNNLAYLEAIHNFVEVLNEYFHNVCELDLVFNFYKVSFHISSWLQGSFCVCAQPMRDGGNSVTPSLIGWAHTLIGWVHTQNDPCGCHYHHHCHCQWCT